MFHRQYMHDMLKECALEENGEGFPVQLLVDHKVSDSRG
jgi:salicylate hydroxylase